MKKILDLLEQKVQWLVLAIAVLYVGYIAYSYVVNPVVTVEMDGETVPPGEIDAKIVEKVGNDLKGLMNVTAVKQPATAPSYVNGFKELMSYANEKPASWPDASVVLLQQPAFPEVMQQVDPRNPNVPIPGAATAKSDLPRIRAARLTAYSKGLTNVLLQPAAPGPAPTGNGVDKTWVSVRFEIDPKEIAAAWDDAKVPQTQLAETAFLLVKLERQEFKGGAWGEPITVTSLPIHVLPALPPNGAAVPQIASFLAWAREHQKEILQPEFYARVRGDEWVVPGSGNAAIAAAPAFDPAKFPPSATPEALLRPPYNLTQDEVDKVMKYRRDHPTTPARGPTRGAPAPRGGGARPGGSPLRGGRGAPAPTPAPDPGAGAAQYDFAPDLASGNPVNFQAAAPEEQPAAAPGDVAQGAAAAAAFPFPTGMFDPHKWVGVNPMIVGWAHDETALPGHVYQYRVTFKLKNPLYYAIKEVKDPATATVFAIESPPSNWSENVEIPSTLNFFIAKKATGTNAITIDVFRNQGGVQNRKSFDVTAGDMIGMEDGGVDYTTGWTMLDVRDDPRTTDSYVLLIDPAGEIQRRDIKEDAGSPRYAQLKQAAGGH